MRSMKKEEKEEREETRNIQSGRCKSKFGKG
jgi:hypothetical protein